MARVLRRTPVSRPASPEKPPNLDAWAAWAASVNGHDQPEHRSSKPLRTAVLTLLVLLVAGAGMAVAFDRLSAAHFQPGTRIGGVAVGSRSLEEAEALVTAKVIRPLQTESVTLRAHHTFRASAWAMGVRMDVGNVVRATHDRQRSMALPARVWHRVFGEPRITLLRSNIDRKRLEAFLLAAAKTIDRPVRDATVELDGDKLKVVPHEVGRTLHVDLAATKVVDGLRSGARNIRLPVEITQPKLRTEQFKRVILVHTGANTLDLYVDGKVSRAFRVATGTPGYATPHGQFTITAKRRNPTWGNPWAPWSMDMPAFIGPGPGNPLGTRALNLSVGGIRIHGSPDAASIGRPASHGCIRMHLRDAETLFDLVDVGTPVVIVR